MKKFIALLAVILYIIPLVACIAKPAEESDEDIYKAKDYAVSVFRDTMPEDYTIIKTTGSVGDVIEDDIYHITLTYIIGDAEKQFSHHYKICVEGTTFTILEETPLE